MAAMQPYLDSEKRPESASTPVHVKRSKDGIKLEPQPSDNPNDPLNWPMSKKITILGIICLSSFAGVAQGGANVSGVVVQSFTYHASVGAMVDSVSLRYFPLE
jgi:hypothetical protein